MPRQRQGVQRAAHNLALAVAHVAQRIKRRGEFLPLGYGDMHHLLLKLNNEAAAAIGRQRRQQDVLLVAGGDGKDMLAGKDRRAGKEGIQVCAPCLTLPARRRCWGQHPRGLPISTAIG